MKRIIGCLSLAVLISVFYSCQKEDEGKKVPKVLTLDAMQSEYIGKASVLGQVSGFEAVALDFECGIEYSTGKSFPESTTIRIKADKKYSEDVYTIELTGLNSEQTYYYRAYCINQSLIYYGESKSFSFEWEDPYNGHEYVDLGLSVKWATCNVGASKPEGYGDYYAWGETSTKSSYTWGDYRFRTSGDSYDNVKFSKYNTDSSRGTVDNKSALDLSDDVARVKWGGSWRMPTKSEFQELRDNCTWIWTTLNGINGNMVTSKKNGYTSRSIFLPAAGWRNDTVLNYAGSYGLYWSSSLSTDNPDGAGYLIFYSGSHSRSNNYRYSGQSVRPVCP